MGLPTNALGNSGGRLYSFGNQPVLIDCNFVVTPTNGTGVTLLKGQGVNNVFMHTSTTPATHNGYLNPNPAVGYALIQLGANYNRYLGMFRGAVAPVTGSALTIDASDAALTAGVPYIINTVGVGPAGQATIAPVADVAGNLSSKYFTLYDSYGNTFVIWFSVAGVGSPPQLGPAAPVGARGLRYIQQSIPSGETAANIGTALDLTIAALESGITGVKSFTASGTTTVTVVSTATQPLAGIPQDGYSVIPDQGPAVPIKFTITSGSATAASVWTDGLGHLYTVATTVSSGTTLLTTGVGVPGNNGVGTLTYVSGPGATTALTFSAAVANFATGFAFALTVSDTNLGDWQGVGLPKGLTPTVGQSFIATATGAGASTGTVKAIGSSNITSIEVIGDPSLSFGPMPVGGSPYVGGWILVRFLVPSFAGTALGTHTHDFTVIGGQAASTTNDIAAYAGPLIGKEQATNATFLGADSATRGGVVAVTAGTPAGTMSLAVAAPTTGSTVYLSFYVDAKFSPSNVASH